VASGILKKCTDAILPEQIRFSLFDGVEPNPTTASLEKGLTLAKHESIHAIVAIGGGSSIDASKAINVLLANGGKIADYHGFNHVRKKGLPLIAIPTTAGTGSEMTSFMLISDSETHQKIVCSDPKIIPDVAILDPTLTLTLPPAVTIESGLDALGSSIEAYVTKAANEYSDALALRATEIIANNIVKVYEEPFNLDSRSAMLIGANMMGLAVNLSYIGAAHSMANPLTKHFGIRHGIAVGMVLPYVMLFNTPSQPQKYKQIALALGVKSERGEDDLTMGRKGAFKVRRLLDQLSLPNNLSRMGVKEDLIPTMADEALAQLSIDYNPVKPDLQQMTNLFYSAIRGEAPLATEA
jgi:alcohol dehydrogenase class IV